MKKLLAIILAALMSLALFSACSPSDSQSQVPPVGDGEQNSPNDDPDDKEQEEQTPPDEEENEPPSEELTLNLSADGYVKGKISDFSEYEGTDAYRVVTTADEFIQAIIDAKDHYTAKWNTETESVDYTIEEGYTEETVDGTVHVIEIANDLNLGYYTLSSALQNNSIVVDYAPNTEKWKPYLSMSDMLLENGMTQIKVENTSNLLIYSKNGAKLTHCGFKLTSDTNVVFRNLEFDELWQWEDAPDPTTASIGDYDWYGWAYFKIGFCGYIWIDHCTFGKSYDGQIDISNPVYSAPGTAFRAPYGADGGSGVHISWCNFNAGSDDEDGYLYKMMAKIEENYLAGGTDYLYYNALRNGGISPEEILYGIAIPQKKGFLCGDDAKQTDDDYTYNLSLQVSFANCKFTNLEDRIPKVRGGNAYMYNCVVDSSQYYGYRTALRSKSAASKVSAINGGWKCGLVSQGIVCGSGASVKAENCIFLGIDSLLKNNDSKATGEYVKGGYQLVNCIYQKGANDAILEGSTPDTAFPNANTSSLTTDLFAWHTEDGSQPFTPTVFELEKLDEILSGTDFGAGAGVNTSLLNLLKCDYNN